MGLFGRWFGSDDDGEDGIAECSGCGDVDSFEVMDYDGDDLICWHCAEKRGLFSLDEAGIEDWR